jgi:multiple sugar transport system permease protein
MALDLVVEHAQRQRRARHLERRREIADQRSRNAQAPALEPLPRRVEQQIQLAERRAAQAVDEHEQLGARRGLEIGDDRLQQLAADRVGGSELRSASSRLGGMSDGAIAWLFITPTVALLLAINIFPLLWTVYMSFTNYKANMGWVKYRMVGIDNYVDLLTDPDIWTAMQTTAHFVFWSILFEVLIGFGLALLINRKFRGHSLWTTVILLPMMLSPAVVGNFWTFLFQPQIGLFNYIVGWIGGVDPGSFQMIGDVKLAPWTIVLVDTWMWTPYVMLICLAGLRSIPDSIYEAAEVDRASAWRRFWSITLPMAMPFLMLAVLFRAIENFKMFDMVNLLTNGGPGSLTETVSITLKRAAFEKWQTGWSSALAIILFLTVFGAANIYVKVLNKVKQR